MSNEEYIKQNTHKGFDELALDLHIGKNEVKRIWNSLDLGWHLTPRTLVDFKRLGHNRYEISNDVVIFIAPATPVVIYKGVVTDFASIPRLLRWIIDKDDKGITMAALTHDVLYATEWMDRRTSDAIFLQIMKHRRAPWWRRTMAYMGVRLGGGFTWKLHKKDEVKKGRRELLAAIGKYTSKENFSVSALEI